MPAQLVRRAARAYATAGAAAIFWAMGITQHTTGTDNVKALSNLALLCGHLGRPGTGLNPLRGQNHARLEEAGLPWPCPTADHPGTPILHPARFTRGLGLFAPVEYRPPAEAADEEYPLLLSTGRILYHWQGGALSRRSAGLDWLAPEAEVEIQPDDAAALGVEEGEVVEVRSRRGAVRARAKLTQRSPRGMIFMTFHYAEAAATLLTNDAVDPVAKIPEYKVAAVRAERIAEVVPA